MRITHRRTSPNISTTAVPLGWLLQTFPMVTEVAFIDAARTRAPSGWTVKGGGLLSIS